MTVALPPLTLAVHTVGRSLRDELVADVRSGLSQPQKSLSPRWFYDERGCHLFERITTLPEYYQTRTETAILSARAAEVAASLPADHLIELGAGTCAKTRILLAALRDQGSLHSFTPFDVSEPTLHRASLALLGADPELRIYALVGDFGAHLVHIPRLGRRLVAFLGGTIGNLERTERRRFLADVRGLLGPDEALLLGLDLVKAPATLVAAYDDGAGVTADFNLNVLRVLNRELGAGFALDDFSHEVRWNERWQRIEMHLRARRPVRVDLGAAGMEAAFQAGETMRTELSCKFTRASATEMLESAALSVRSWYTDADRRFALALATPA